MKKVFISFTILAIATTCFLIRDKNEFVEFKKLQFYDDPSNYVYSELTTDDEKVIASFVLNYYNYENYIHEGKIMVNKKVFKDKNLHLTISKKISDQEWLNVHLNYLIRSQKSQTN